MDKKMAPIVRRGFIPTDIKEFDPKNTELLRQVQMDIYYLINRGYEINRCVTFVGNRFGLSKRQRMALVRSTSKESDIKNRFEKRENGLAGKTIHIDGFNLIIPLEIALSNSTLLHCMDGTVRDLAGLHGTYRIIDKTSEAIRLINQKLTQLNIEKAVFYLDAPVSNSGRLKEHILEQSSDMSFQTEVNLIYKVDQTLYEKEYVVTGDAIILDHCKSWVNLCYDIITEQFPKYPFIRLNGYSSTMQKGMCSLHV